jgi:hypothetical protein
MWFSRKYLINPQHPLLQWNLSGIIVEQSTEKSNLAAKGLGRPRDEKFCGCVFEKRFNSILYKDCSVSRMRISFLAFLLCHWSIFFGCTHLIADYWNIFQDHCLLQEQLSHWRLSECHTLFEEARRFL